MVSGNTSPRSEPRVVAPRNGADVVTFARFLSLLLALIRGRCSNTPFRERCHSVAAPRAMGLPATPPPIGRQRRCFNEEEECRRLREAAHTAASLNRAAFGPEQRSPVYNIETEKRKNRISSFSSNRMQMSQPSRQPPNTNDIYD
ncbi:hypothetical protein AAFF_G00173550 [Aldrovandia affinis]|uniref:Uncharacterized protein n=1 Tax=Aldrovandia affinis TaxID=143900 RepID=A0AAD7SYZ1_9TELE|nr:hypothetical protein AAFF_G00173550 [Aldrovandia affinis]